MSRPVVIVIGGPNGAGKSTLASLYVPPSMTFVNADEVAKTLPTYPSRDADLQAGRIVIEQMEELGNRRASFAVETTLAGRTLAAHIGRLRRVEGYVFQLIFIWSPSVELCVQRVASRVRRGGHHIPEETIRRRYSAGIRNFFGLYQPLADRWYVYNNSALGDPRLVAEGGVGEDLRIHDPSSWNSMVEGASDD
jgi:predicted ABC-type ATPase